jgi:hypothetical protein
MNDLEGEREISWPYCFSSLRGQLTVVDEHFVIGVSDSIRRKMSSKDVEIFKSHDDFKVKKSFFLNPSRMRLKIK